MPDHHVPAGDPTTAACPCGSGRPLADCCGPYLRGALAAPTPDALMRSRYAAYALGDEAYLLRTWHTRTRPAALNLAAQRDTVWTRLEVVAAHGNQVEFKAYYRCNGEPEVLHERSRFRREDGRWRYLDGHDGGRGVDTGTGRNAPCPCGSGRKFKRCCGAA